MRSMWNKRKPVLLASFMVVILSLQGCSTLSEISYENGMISFTKREKSVSSEDTDEYAIIDKSMYLDTSLQSNEVSNEDKYTIYTVKRGDFVTEYSSLKAEPYYNSFYPVKYEYEVGTMIFENFTKGRFDYVQKGEVIAKVHNEIDLTKLDELKLKVERYKQRYEEAKSSYEKKKKEYERDFLTTSSALENMELQLDYDEFIYQWEETDQDWMNTIKDTQEMIDDYEAALKVTEIVAEYEGFIFYDYEHPLREGDTIKSGDTICNMIANENAYVTVDNSNQMLSYGNTVTAIFPNKEYKGVVVNPNVKATSENTRSDIAYIKLDCDLQTLFTTSSNINISYTTNSMKDVLIVDKQYVTYEDEIPYVTVLKEDGTLLKTTFKPGSTNNNYVWVFSGLSEGMQLIK